jgi:hypothetical protein
LYLSENTKKKTLKNQCLIDTTALISIRYGYIHIEDTKRKENRNGFRKHIKGLSPIIAEASRLEVIDL